MVKIILFMSYLVAANLCLVAQIPVTKSAAMSETMYDSLENIENVSALTGLKGQEVIFFPLPKADDGYYGVLTEPLKQEELEELGACNVPKDKAKVYSPEKDHPEMTQQKALALSTWRIVEVIVSEEASDYLPMYSYIKLENEQKTNIYWIPGNCYLLCPYLLLKGYYEKQKQEALTHRFVTRNTVTLNDCYTKKSFTSYLLDEWKVEDVIISDGEGCPELFLLLVDAKGHHVTASLQLMDVLPSKADQYFRFFMDQKQKFTHKISNENWKKVLQGTPFLSMTKGEALVCFGQPLNGMTWEELLVEDTWEYVSGLKLTFQANKLIDLSNYSPE